MNLKINDKIFTSFPNLESERLIFREFKIKDAEDLFFIRSNDEVMEYMDTTKHNSIKDSEELISSVHESYKNKNGINWAIVEKSTNSFIGYFGYWRMIPEHCRAEIGYALKPKYWGKGYMKEALNKLVDFGFNELGLHSIEANVNINNNSSIKLLEKKGFIKEAHFRENYLFNGVYLDSIIYSLIESNN